MLRRRTSTEDARASARRRDGNVATSWDRTASGRCNSRGAGRCGCEHEHPGSRRGAASVADRRAVDVRPAAGNFAGDRRVSDNNLHQTRLAVVDCHGCPKETARKIARTPRATFAITHWKCPRNCRKGRAGRQAGSRAFRPLVHHVQIRQRDRRPTFGLWARIVVGGYRTRARSRDEMNESNLFVASSTKKRRPSLASARPKSAPAPFGLPDLSSSAVPACLPAA